MDQIQTGEEQQISHISEQDARDESIYHDTKCNMKENNSEEMESLEESQKVQEFLDTLDDAKKLRENTRCSMVQLLNQGLQLKLDIHSLREDFQSLLNGVTEFANPEIGGPSGCPSTELFNHDAEKSKIIQNQISEAVNDHVNVIGPSEKYNLSAQSATINVSNDLRRSTKLQVTFAENCDSDNSPGVKIVAAQTKRLPVILDTPTHLSNKNTALKSERKTRSASRNHRRHSAQIQPRQSASASRITSRNLQKSTRRHSSSSATDRRKRIVDSDENIEIPKYQILKVSDTPTFENQQASTGRARAIYKNHKRRLMARRESGDGAPCENVPNKYVRLSGIHTPVQSIVSPMRRLPIRDRTSLGQSPYTQPDVQTAASIWRRPQSQSTKKYGDNSDRLRPKFFSVKSSQRTSSVESPIDPLSLPRPSPEGLYSPGAGTAPKTCYCSRANCDELNESYSQVMPVSHQPNPYQFDKRDVPRHPPRYQPKKVNKYSKRLFPKTPMAQRDMQYPLETIDEKGLVHIVMTPEHYNRHIQQMYHANHVTTLQRQAAGTSLLSRLSSQHTRKQTTGLKDISQISHISSSMHEQPSNINVQGDFHSTFQYPLHSTMSYPLHSTMRNNSLIPEDGHDLSSINIDSPLTPVKNNLRSEARRNSSNVGVNTSDLRTAVPQANLKQHIAGIVVKTTPDVDTPTSAQFEDEESKAVRAGIECDAATPSSVPIVKSMKEMVPYPQTPSHVLNSYYKLAYESDSEMRANEGCPPATSPSTDCDSSYVSIDTDSPKQKKDFDKDGFPAATPASNACEHAGTVTCRCHLKTVKRIHHFDQRGTNEVRALFDQRPAPMGFSESTVFMDSQLREIYPMDVDGGSIRSNVGAQKNGNTSKKNASNAKESSQAPADHCVQKNDSATSNNSSKSSGEGRGNLDFMSNMCHSIESIDSIYVEDVPKFAKPHRTVIEVKPLSKKPPVSKTHRKDHEIMTHTRVETNCLNLAKMMTTKDTKTKLTETMRTNRTLAVNPNVTMVADGCLGFLRKKKSASSKKDKKSSKLRKFSMKGAKIKPDLDENFEEEDKENSPRLALFSAPQHRSSRNHPVTPSYPTMSSSQCDRTSVTSGSIGDGCIGHDMKRKLSKRMKEFRRSTLSDSGRMHQQSLGHV